MCVRHTKLSGFIGCGGSCEEVAHNSRFVSQFLVRQREITILGESKAGVPGSLPEEAVRIRGLTVITAPDSVVRRTPGGGPLPELDQVQALADICTVFATAALREAFNFADTVQACLPEAA